MGIVLRERIEAETRGMGLELEASAWRKLEELAGLWAKYAPSMNLSGARDEMEVAAHVLEGLQAVECAKRAGLSGQGMAWLDVGSGAGFPGLVAAASTRCQMTLVEPRARRAAFLELALATIDARESRVLRARLSRSTWEQVGETEAWEPQKRCFAIVSARAVFAPGRWLREGEIWAQTGGVVLAHLTHGAANPGGREPVARVDGPRWSVRAYRVEDD